MPAFMMKNVKDARLMEAVAGYQFTDQGEPPLEAVLRAIAAYQGWKLEGRLAAAGSETSRDAVEAFVRDLKLRPRRLQLEGDWWGRCGVEPIIAWHGEARRIVALLPRSGSGYTMRDPLSAKPVPVTQNVANSISPDGLALYRALPFRPTSWSDLFDVFPQSGRGEICRLILAACAAAVLSITPPLLVSNVLDKILTHVGGGQPGPGMLGVIMLVVCGTGFRIAQAIATLRLNVRMDVGAQSALIDRLLRLSPSFFRQYATGDLVERVLGVSRIHQLISENVAQLIPASVAFLISMGFLLRYGGNVFSFVVIPLVAWLVASMIGSALKFRWHVNYLEAKGSAEGLIMQIICAIGKIRVADAAQRAFAKWNHIVFRQNDSARKVRLTNNLTNAMDVVVRCTVIVAVFYFHDQFFESRANGGDSSVTMSDFLAFLVALGQSFAFGSVMARAASEMLVIAPLYKRMLPIMSNKPECEGDGRSPERIAGGIELRQVKFKYPDSAATLIDGLDMCISPGQFVALVGESGSGKSTLIRLLLGFEEADAGEILYDGVDIGAFDLTRLRSQIGVVLQAGQLTSGNIFENIAGGATLSFAEAWEAARLAGIADDIEQFPMKMHTVVVESGSTLSGGQRQRILLARALARKPKILLLDEATSALDNISQSVVCKSLEKIGVTRIVIAHRLSTIRLADTIVVMRNGRVAEQGTYEELIRKGGHFARMAEEQQALR